MKTLTYDGWKLVGYHVRKGEQSSTRNKKGEATFTADQVDEDECCEGMGPDDDFYGGD